METLYVTRDAVLEREGSTLVVRVEGSPKRRFPVETLQHVVVAGEARLTTALLTLAGHSDIRLTVLDHYACRLSEAGRRRTLEMWTAKVEQTNGDSVSMRSLMRSEALAIERHVLGMGRYKPFARSI